MQNVHYEETWSGRTQLPERFTSAALPLVLLGCLWVVQANPGTNARLEEYEGRMVVAIDLSFENSPPDTAAQTEFSSLLKIVSGTEFSAVRVRDSLQAL